MRKKSSQLSEHVNHRTVAHAHNNRERKKQLTANTFSVSALKCSSNTRRRRRSSTSHYKCVSSFLLAISFVFNDEFRKKNELIIDGSIVLNAGEKEEDFPSVVVVHGPDDFVYSRV
jgi:hypothetical protein